MLDFKLYAITDRWLAVDLKKCVGRNERQNGEAFVLQFLLNGTDKDSELAHVRPSLSQAAMLWPAFIVR